MSTQQSPSTSITERVSRLGFTMCAIATLALIVMIGIAMWTVNTFIAAQEADAEWLKVVNLTRQLTKLAVIANAPGNDVFDSHDPIQEERRLAQAKEDFDAKFSELSKCRQASDSNANGVEIKKHLQSIKKSFGEMGSEATIIMNFFKKSNETAAGAHMASMDRAYAVLTNAILNLQEYIGEVQTAEANRQVAEAKQFNLTSIVVGCFLISIIVALSFRLAKIMKEELSQKLDPMTKVAELIAKGDLSTNIRMDSERDDEIGKLSTAFKTMTNNLREDNKQIADVIRLINQTVLELGGAASQSAGSASETAAAVTETTVTSEEVRQTALVVAQMAQSVSEMAQRAANISHEGRRSSDETIKEMGRAQSQMSSIGNSMLTLSEKSQSIVEIISSVDDIAQQSNLLAVNASIEASKAGEAGKGFAVVAQEVRALSNQSKEATAEVRRILSEIQNATGSAVTATEQGKQTVQQAVNRSADSGKAINDLNESIAEAALAAQQIAKAAQEQLSGIDQVVTAMIGIKEASDQHLSSVRNLEDTSRRLADMRGMLQSIMDKYST